MIFFSSAEHSLDGAVASPSGRRWWLEGDGDEKRERESSGVASSSPLLPAVDEGVWGHVLQAFAMIPGENEAQVASDKPSPKVPDLPGDVTLPLCRPSRSLPCWTGGGNFHLLDQHKPRPKLNKERTVYSGICKSFSLSLGKFITLNETRSVAVVPKEPRWAVM